MDGAQLSSCWPGGRDQLLTNRENRRAPLSFAEPSSLATRSPLLPGSGPVRCAGTTARSSCSSARGRSQSQSSDLLRQPTDAASALQFLRLGRSLAWGPREWTSAITASGRTSRWEDALAALRVLQALPGLRPDEALYNAVFSALAKAGPGAGSAEGERGGWALAGALLEELRADGLRPDSRLCESKRGAAPLDIFSASSVTSACEKASQWSQALALLGLVRADCVEPTVVTYSAVISSCARASSADTRASAEQLTTSFLWARVLGILREMAARRCDANVVTFSAAVSALAAAGQSSLALDQLSSMERLRVWPNLITYNSALAACGNSHDWPGALSLLADMHAMPGVS
ncbi:unnamed protein product, partial [Polarella glacialis]